jgi:hypothetical protein
MLCSMRVLWYRCASTKCIGLKTGCLLDSATRTTCDAWRPETRQRLVLFLQTATEQQQQPRHGWRLGALAPHHGHPGLTDHDANTLTTNILTNRESSVC